VPILACPHCHVALELTATGASCGSGHSFDRAREGYLNLLVGGRLASVSSPGDTPDSLAARRRFLSQGFYAPIAAALAQTVGSPAGALLDVGCGEGYYLAQLTAGERYGLDIAKAGVRMAARLLPDCQFVVGSAYRLPVLDASVEVVVSVFAPHPFDEFDRVLQPGGRWVTVTPGPDHLCELRPADNPASGERGERRQQRFERRADPPAEADTAQRVRFALDLTADAATDLWAMTPLRWQTPNDGAAQARSVTVDVWVATAPHAFTAR